jgi:hypothetical protein
VDLEAKDKQGRSLNVVITYRSSLQGTTYQSHDGSHGERKFATTSLAHPCHEAGANDATGGEEAIDGSNNAVRIRIVWVSRENREEEIGKEVGLAQSSCNDAQYISISQTSKTESKYNLSESQVISSHSFKL